MRFAFARVLVLAIAAAGLAACASSRTLSGTVSDLGTNAELKSVLFSDRSHDYSDVDLTLYDGRLMLTGSMRTEDGHKKLVENAWKAKGVKQVIDEIIIADKTTPYRLLIEVMFTLGQNEFAKYHLMVMQAKDKG